MPRCSTPVSYTHLDVYKRQRYTIVDTAGLRRKSQIDEDVEYYGFCLLYTSQDFQYRSVP